MPNHHLGIGIVKWYSEVLNENQANLRLILGVYFLLMIQKNVNSALFFFLTVLPYEQLFKMGSIKEFISFH